ncbi:hypothetical protein [Croceicoccus marinus]|uniref:Uncharacterized protein n=1 Tax=Croceicoccus marinus TaxID=450378 RepID=A0A217EYT1_9SPHN|nr:hypothetical protein [Croceicoccus marinus]ARU18287.1 hypothetical protein A9D14_18195 [Croceicoccus marinus]
MRKSDGCLSQILIALVVFGLPLLAFGIELVKFAKEETLGAIICTSTVVGLVWLYYRHISDDR